MSPLRVEWMKLQEVKVDIYGVVWSALEIGAWIAAIYKKLLPEVLDYNEYTVDLHLLPEV